MLTERQIQEDREQRERLGPIAQALGLSLDPLDRELTQALELIVERRQEGGASKPPSTLGASTTHTTGAPAKYDLGDQVAECMRARNEGRAPAAWATSTLPNQRKAGGSR